MVPYTCAPVAKWGNAIVHVQTNSYWQLSIKNLLQASAVIQISCAYLLMVPRVCCITWSCTDMIQRTWDLLCLQPVLRYTFVEADTKIVCRFLG